MTADDALIRQLRDRIDELEEEIHQLHEDLVPPDNPFLHMLSHQHAALLLGLYRRKIATYTYLDAINIRSGRVGRGEDGYYPRHRVKVAIYKLKKKLRPYGVEVSTRHGLGYYLDDENRTKVETLMEKKNDPPA